MATSGRIAHRFINEMSAVEGAYIASIYNPHVESARITVVECGRKDLSEFCTNQISELTNNVDAVYIAAPHETHYSYARQMLVAGKHVLCEKPMSFRRSEAEELFAMAKERDLILFRGFLT